MTLKPWFLLLAPTLVLASGPPADMAAPLDEAASAVDVPLASAGLAVTFRFDSAALEIAAKRALRPIGDRAKYDPTKIFVVEGYSDVRGSRNYNMTLSRRRVAAVRDFLIDIGVHPQRVKTIAFGETRASVNVLEVADHVKDRRVVVRVENAAPTS